MNNATEALNIELLKVDGKITKGMMEVTTRDVFEQNSTRFHNNGLFSTNIFGEAGSSSRLSLFGYIDMGLQILHPKIYKELTSLNGLYKGILEGTAYAIYDTKEKDFIESDSVDGSTGFNFFMNKYDDIKYKLTSSVQREFKIKFIKNYTKDDVLMDKYLVMPAGLRDYKLLESGKALENEVNALYRKLISVSSSAKVFKTDIKNGDNEYISAVRKRLQKVGNDIYEYIETLLDGKSKFIQGKWAKRAVSYGTRNVITASPVVVTDLDDEDNAGMLNSDVGLLQTAKGILPITIFNTRTKFLQDIFDLNSSNAMLINPRTMKREPKEISEKSRSVWVTDDGVEETINKLMQDDIKNSPIMVDGYYLLLIYEHDDKIEILKSIDSLGAGANVKQVRPITYGELFYLSIFDVVKDYPAYITRYPIVNYGGIVPVIPYMKTTLRSLKRMVKLPNSTEYVKAIEYPVIGENWYASLSVPQIFLVALGADQ